MNPYARRILQAIETQVEKIIEEKSDALVEKALETLKLKIPGGIDDAFIDAAKEEVKAAVKNELLKQAEKIDGEDGSEVVVLP